MVVKLKKKTMDNPSDAQIGLDLSDELQEVRQAIINLTEDEDTDMSKNSNAAAEEHDDETSSTPVKSKKRSKVEKAAPEAAPKAKKTKTAEEPAPKESKGAKESSGDTVTLSDICSEFDVEPAEARKALRGTELKPESGRWEWPKKHIDLKEVRNIVKGLAKK